MARHKLLTILQRPDKGMAATHGVTGTLSRLFRKMMVELNITPMKFSALLADYVRDKRNKVPDNRRDQSSIMGNLTKELSRPDMTWKVFCKGVRFLQFTRFEICLRAYRSNGKPIEFTPMAVDLYERDNDAE